MDGKKRTCYIDIIPIMENDGLKVKKLFTANTRVACDWDKKKHKIIHRKGSKFLGVNRDYVLLEIG